MTGWKFVISASVLMACALPATAQDRPVDAPGVQVDTKGVEMLHRTPVGYPLEAIEKRIEGTVVADLTLNSLGEVADARIVSGPMELRKPVLASVLGWHFATNAGEAQVEVRFELPADSSQLLASTLVPLPPNLPVVFSRLDVLLLPKTLRDRVLKAITLQKGQTVTAADLTGAVAAIRAIDEHLLCLVRSDGEGKVVIHVGLSTWCWSGANPPTPKRIRIGGNVQSVNLIQRTMPAYPADAKAARIQGTVKFAAVIGKDGHIESLQLISGHPLLVAAARDAVKTWIYKPTMLNGEPVEVVTTIEVDFRVDSGR